MAAEQETYLVLASWPLAAARYTLDNQPWLKCIEAGDLADCQYSATPPKTTIFVTLVIGVTRHLCRFHVVIDIDSLSLFCGCRLDAIVFLSLAYCCHLVFVGLLLTSACCPWRVVVVDLLVVNFVNPCDLLTPIVQSLSMWHWHHQPNRYHYNFIPYSLISKYIWRVNTIVYMIIINFV